MEDQTTEAVDVSQRPTATEANTGTMVNLVGDAATKENNAEPPTTSHARKTVVKVSRRPTASKSSTNALEKLTQHATVVENVADLRARIASDTATVALLDRLRARDGPNAPISKTALDLLVFLHDHRRFFGKRRRVFSMLTGYSEHWWKSSAAVKTYNKKIPKDW